MKPLNQCGDCGLDFTSVEAFERHRTGVHEYTLTEGLLMLPPREDGRRCRTAEELADLGYEQDATGRWHNPARSKRAARHFFRKGARDA